MKVGKFLAAVIFAVFFLAGNCFAMKFSQPVDLNGYVVVSEMTRYKGFIVENATDNDGVEYKKLVTRWDGKKRTFYSKGVARFGNGEDALYAHYDMDKDTRNVYFGGKNLNNTFPIWGIFEYQGEKIYKINTNAGITMYLIETGFDVPGADYYLLGKQKDGKWVKYIDTPEMIKKYFGNTTLTCGLKNVDTNTIIFRFGSPWRVSGGNYIEGEFRFKWDEVAQWFSVEQTKY